MHWALVLLIGLLVVTVLFVAAVGCTVLGYQNRIKPIGQEEPLSEEFKAEKVDVVYTWVDGSDEAWQAKRRAAKGLEPLPPGNGSNRFTESGELEHSIKATKRNMAGLLGTIYVVTPGQSPAFLNDEDNVVVIDQAKLLPEGQACFNSNVIEMFLFRIPNLREWFLYMNDDMFIHKPVTKETFFYADHKPRMFSDGWGFPPFFATAVTFGQEPTALSRTHTENVLRERYAASKNVSVHPMTAHAPIVISKKVLQTLYRENRELYDEATTHVFRQPDDLVVTAFLYPHYMIDHGKAKMGNDSKCAYVFVSNSDWINRKQFDRLERDKDVQFVCLNDSRTKNFEKTSDTIRTFLKDTYAN